MTVSVIGALLLLLIPDGRFGAPSIIVFLVLLALLCSTLGLIGVTLIKTRPRLDSRLIGAAALGLLVTAAWLTSTLPPISNSEHRALSPLTFTAPLFAGSGLLFSAAGLATTARRRT